MTDNKPDNEEHRTSLSRTGTLIICALVLLAGAGITVLIFSTEPSAQRETATRKTAMLVETVEVRRGTFRPAIVETGTVMPARDVRLSPQVDGVLVELHPDFEPGGFIAKGETIARIEPADYENMLQMRKSELMQAETDLKLEMGRQEIAKRDYQLFDDQLPEGDTSLVLRQPQLAAAKVRVDAARAAVDQAELNLRRTRIASPFDARILTRDANLGSQVASGTALARIVGIDQYWVMATVAPGKVPFLEFPSKEERGAAVHLRNRTSWPAGTTRTGNLLRLVGSLEPQTRLARIIIEVPDPLNRENTDSETPPLLVGEYLEVRIEGKPIDNVVRLDRDYLRKNDTAWVMDEASKLRIRELDIVFKDAAHAYVRSGLEDGDRVVTTNLATVTSGAGLRTEAGE